MLSKKTQAEIKWAAWLVGTAILDAAILGAMYYLALLLRLDFKAPAFGWSAAFWSACVSVLIQMILLAAVGAYRKNWSRFALDDGIRIVSALAISTVLFLAARILLPGHAHIRPPYSVSCIAFTLSCAALISPRILYAAFANELCARRGILGRAENKSSSIPESVMSAFKNRVVMVTGAGGTIGSELSRQILSLEPSTLLLVERSENALYEIEFKLRDILSRKGGSTKIVPLMVDIADAGRMDKIFTADKPDFVIHAAAYKHVPMAEANPKATIANNLLATVALIHQCAIHNVENFLFISTDKAVRPRSVMGITKRLCECAVIQKGLEGSKGKFSTVRFGNVLGSSGSVIPLFEKQIAAKSPVTVTDPRMVRYFMSVSEAVALSLTAAAMGKSGEIFVLDMGNPLSIVELAERTIRRAGYRPYHDIPIVFTGIRPGEKLFEELDVGKMSAVKTDFAKIYICNRHVPSEQVLANALAQCERLVKSDLSDSETIAALKKISADVESDCGA